MHCKAALKTITRLLTPILVVSDAWLTIHNNLIVINKNDTPSYAINKIMKQNILSFLIRMKDAYFMRQERKHLLHEGSCASISCNSSIGLASFQAHVAFKGIKNKKEKKGNNNNYLEIKARGTHVLIILIFLLPCED